MLLLTYISSQNSYLSHFNPSHHVLLTNLITSIIITTSKSCNSVPYYFRVLQCLMEGRHAMKRRHAKSEVTLNDSKETEKTGIGNARSENTASGYVITTRTLQDKAQGAHGVNAHEVVAGVENALEGDSTDGDRVSLLLLGLVIIGPIIRRPNWQKMPLAQRAISPQAIKEP